MPGADRWPRRGREDGLVVPPQGRPGPRSTQPTIGYNSETFQFQGVEFLAFDVCGAEKLQTLWRHYDHGLDAIILVVDAASPFSTTTLAVAKSGLETLHREGMLDGKRLLILANKQDLCRALSAEDLWDRLDLDALVAICKIHVQPTSVKTGEGLDDALGWLHREMVNPLGPNSPGDGHGDQTARFLRGDVESVV